MGVRHDFERGQVHLDLGDTFALTQHMKAAGPVVEWQQFPTALRDNDIAGAHVRFDDVQFVTN